MENRGVGVVCGVVEQGFPARAERRCSNVGTWTWPMCGCMCGRVCVDVTFVFWLFDTGPFRLDPLRRLRK